MQQLHPVTWKRGTANTEPGLLSPTFLSEPVGGSPASTAFCSANFDIVDQNAKFKRFETAPL